MHDHDADALDTYRRAARYRACPNLDFRVLYAASLEPAAPLIPEALTERRKRKSVRRKNAA